MIGVFDSGIGGLSVLRVLREQLPQVPMVYVADSAHTPYGERGDAFVLARSRAIGHHLLQNHGVHVLVMACNTATAAAGSGLRTEFAPLPIVGVEPALKPALQATRTGRVGVMATRGTLASQKFQALAATLTAQAPQVEFIAQPCDGLASAIEQQDTPKIRALCSEYTRAMGQFGTQNRQIDTLVLGCTHYPFARDILQDLLGPEVQILDNAPAIARQTQRLLGPDWLNPSSAQPPTPCLLLATANTLALRQAAQRWLGGPFQVEQVNC